MPLKTKILLPLVLLLQLLTAQSAVGTTASQTTVVAELSPLRSVMGAPEFRLETVRGNIGAGLNWSQERRPSERIDYTDQSQSLRIEAIWYPVGLANVPVFVGAGLQHEDTLVGRQQERSHITWARTSAAEANDKWVNHDSHVSATQTIGYRYLAKSLLTASIGAFRDELLTTQSRNEETTDIYSTDPDLNTRGRNQLRTGVTLQIGMYFQ